MDRPDGLVWEELSQDQRRHYKNRAWNTERSLQRWQELRRWSHSDTLGSEGCIHCGETDPLCLDFHHRDGTEKEMAINKMVPYGDSRADIRAEMEKCALVCANCHLILHRIQVTSHDDVGAPTEEVVASTIAGVDVTVVEPSRLSDADEWSLTKDERLRAWTWAYKHCHCQGCRECGETTPVCLRFHHPEEMPKTNGVGAMVTDCSPADEVTAEARQCVVLCADCHRRDHLDGFNPQEGESVRVL